MKTFLMILGFAIYCAICYAIDWLEYNYCKIWLILTGNYEDEEENQEIKQITKENTNI